LLWETWKTFPEILPFRSVEDLTEDELEWVWTQIQLDSGMQYCDRCDRFGHHYFCGACGVRYDGITWRDCPGCKAKVSTHYCALCGTPVITDFQLKFERNEVDWMGEEVDNAQKHYRRIVGRIRPELRTYLVDPMAILDKDEAQQTVAKKIESAFRWGR